MGARNFPSPSPQLKEPIETEKMLRISIFLSDVSIWVFFPHDKKSVSDLQKLESDLMTYALDIILNRIHEIVPLIISPFEAIA